MARARNIKPKFFKNDELAALSPLARLLFIGMWTIADYRGVIEYRPKRLKAEVLPYDECDIEALVINLDKSGFISIFSVQGQPYLKVIKFERHQTPHKNERDAGSELPDISQKDSVFNELKKDEINLDKDGTTRAESLFLNPSLLNPVEVEPPPQKRKSIANASRLPAGWTLSSEDIAYCKEKRPDLKLADVSEAFRDYWLASGGKKVDWSAAWRSWVQKERRGHSQGPPGGYQTANEKAKTLADRLTGKSRNEPTFDFIDLNAVPP